MNKKKTHQIKNDTKTPIKNRRHKMNTNSSLSIGIRVNETIYQRHHRTLFSPRTKTIEVPQKPTEQKK